MIRRAERGYRGLTQRGEIQVLLTNHICSLRNTDRGRENMIQGVEKREEGEESINEGEKRLYRENCFWAQCPKMPKNKQAQIRGRSRYK